MPRRAGPEGLGPLDVALGARIRLRRTALGMTQSQLAKALGVSFQQVQKYELGANRVSASMLVRIAEALQCSGGELLGGEDPTGRLSPKLLTMLASPACVDLLRAYGRIRNPQARAGVVAVVVGLSRAARGGGKTSEARTERPPRARGPLASVAAPGERPSGTAPPGRPLEAGGERCGGRAVPALELDRLGSGTGPAEARGRDAAAVCERRVPDRPERPTPQSPASFPRLEAWPAEVEAMVAAGRRPLAALRAWRGLTQAELAARAYLYVDVLQRLEDGRLPLNGVDEAKLNRALGVADGLLHAARPSSKLGRGG